MRARPKTPKARSSGTSLKVSLKAFGFVNTKTAPAKSADTPDLMSTSWSAGKPESTTTFVVEAFSPNRMAPINARTIPKRFEVGEL
jgi:hypothetical protein